MPQLLAPRTVRRQNVYDGIYLMYWGLFLKVVIADNMALIVDPYFDTDRTYTGVESLLVMYAFAVEIFCDFAGYSEIARGLGKCMGIELTANFRWPYFVTSPGEFWKNWHVTLSTWLRDYLYIPLGGNRYGQFLTLRNLILTMLLGGLWHGAAWTFIAWGIYHGLLLIVFRVSERTPSTAPPPKPPASSTLARIVKIVLYFHVTCIGWVLFRSHSLTQASDILSSLVCQFHASDVLACKDTAATVVKFSWLLLLIQILQFRRDDLMIVRTWPFVSRAILYFIMYYCFVSYGMQAVKPFIYFQF